MMSLLLKNVEEREAHLLLGPADEGSFRKVENCLFQ